MLAAIALTAACMMPAHAGNTAAAGNLPHIGPAPGFTLTDQDGRRFSARDMRGKIGVVTFMFTTCSAACPLLTAKLVDVQRRIDAARHDVFFAAVTIDPLNDTPAVLKNYAMAHSADLERFAFLTGPLRDIEDLARRYTVYRKETAGPRLDHTFLTSIIDRNGMIRVQYMGTRFDASEFLADLRSLLAENRPK